MLGITTGTLSSILTCCLCLLSPLISAVLLKWMKNVRLEILMTVAMKMAVFKDVVVSLLFVSIMVTNPRLYVVKCITWKGYVADCTYSLGIWKDIVLA